MKIQMEVDLEHGQKEKITIYQKDLAQQIMIYQLEKMLEVEK